MKKKLTRTPNRGKLAVNAETIATLRPVSPDRTKEIVGGVSSKPCQGQCSFSANCVTD
jgi:hypothetical protein